jgi:hypothetical protein
MLCYGLNRGCSQWCASLFSMHDVWIPPPVLEKFIPGWGEGGVPLGWPGPIQVTHKFGTRTYFDGHQAIQQSHDVGYLIPHLALPPNLLILLHSLVSKHKVMIPVSSVDIEGKMMGTYLIIFLSLICCNPVSLPTGVLLPFGGTVISSLSAKDILLGVGFIFVDMLFDAIWSLVMKGDVWGRPLRNAKNRIVQSAGKTVYKQIWADSPIKATWYKNNLSKILSKWPVPAVWAQKVTDHIAKSWIAGPLIKGGTFQALATTGMFQVPRTQLPSVSMGRGQRKYGKVNFFPGGIFGNTSN